RLRLANVSPVLLRELRDDKLTLEQMMAFALSDDHAQQERVYDAALECGSYALRPERIRVALTTSEVPSTDPRARFVTIERYEAAGGAVRRDLFDANDACYLLDSTLLDQL